MSDTVSFPQGTFVATIDCYPMDSFSERIERLLALMKGAGFDAECPGTSSGMSGVFVPTSQKDEARAFLRKLQLDWIIAWVSEDQNFQAHAFGYYAEVEGPTSRRS